jgi:hypothetical protein
VAPTTRAFTEEKDIEELEESSVQFQALERRILEILRDAGDNGILQEKYGKNST